MRDTTRRISTVFVLVWFGFGILSFLPACTIADVEPPMYEEHTTYTWTNKPDPAIHVSIAGSGDSASAPHSVTLTVDTGPASASGFVLESPDLASLTTILPSQLPWTTTVSNRQVTLRKEAGQPYELTVEKLPNSVPRGYMTDVSNWCLELKDLPTPNSVTATISSLTRALTLTTAAVLIVFP